MALVHVEVDVLVTGELRIPGAYAFRPEGGNRLTRAAAALRPGDSLRSPCLAFAVRHPRQGTVLVDSGLHPDAARDLRRDFGLRMSILFRGLRPASEPFEAQLRGIGVDPEEVKRVVMTHLHVDHTSGMRLLPRARFTCAAEEWRSATGPGAGGRGYVSHHLPPESRMTLLDFEAEGEPHGPFDRTIDLFGDDSVRVVSTPGHTRGHLSVLLRVGDGRRVLLVGDAAYTLRSIDEQRLPLMTAGDRAYRDSLRQIGEFGRAEPAAVVVPSHDPEAWRALAGDPALTGPG